MSKRSRALTIITDRREYTGTLKEKIVRRADVINPADQSEHLSPESLKAAQKKQVSKLPDLFDFFFIDKTSATRWEQLAMSLAEHCVPGMQIAIGRAPKTGGRPRVWNKGDATEHFVFRVDQLVSQGTKKVDALKQAGKEIGSAASLGSLRNRYSQGHARWAQIELKADIFLANEPALAKLLGF